MILYTEQENSMKKVFLNESQLRFLLETGDLTPNDNGTMDFKIDPIQKTNLLIHVFLEQEMIY